MWQELSCLCYWSRFSLSFTCFSTFAIKDVLKLFLGCSSKPCTLRFICLPWKILSHIVNETVVCEKYKSLSLVKGQRKSVLLLSAFSPRAFQQECGSQRSPFVCLHGNEADGCSWHRQEAAAGRSLASWPSSGSGMAAGSCMCREGHQEVNVMNANFGYPLCGAIVYDHLKP